MREAFGAFIDALRQHPKLIATFFLILIIAVVKVETGDSLQNGPEYMGYHLVEFALDVFLIFGIGYAFYQIINMKK
jgi:hypothetical protein